MCNSSGYSAATARAPSLLGVRLAVANAFGPTPCKSCGSPILFARTSLGRTMPLDASAQKRFVLDEHGVVRAVDTYQSHFASCPNADAHRAGLGRKHGDEGGGGR
jgi:hypothetical protein